VLGLLVNLLFSKTTKSNFNEGRGAKLLGAGMGFMSGRMEGGLGYPLSEG